MGRKILEAVETLGEEPCRQNVHAFIYQVSACYLPRSRIHWLLSCPELFAFPTLTLNITIYSASCLHLTEFKQINNPMKEKKIRQRLCVKNTLVLYFNIKIKGKDKEKVVTDPNYVQTQVKIKTDSTACYVYLLAVTKLTQSIIGLK